MNKKEKLDYISKSLSSRDPVTASFCSSSSLEKGSELAQTYAPDTDWYSSGDPVRYALMTVMYYARRIVNHLRPMPKTLLYLESSDRSYTTGKSYVCISTDMYSDKFSSTYTEEFKFDIFLGLTVHELAHLNNTNFKSHKDYLKSWNETLLKEAVERITTSGKISDEDTIKKLASLDAKNKVSFIHSIWNTLEDERIETIESLKNPKYSAHLAATKHHYFKLVEEALRISKKASPEKFTSTSDVVQQIFNLVRYPAKLDFSVVEANLDLFVSARDILDPYPETPEYVLEATSKIYRLVKEFQEEQDSSDEGQDQASEELRSLAEAILTAIKNESEESAMDSEDSSDGEDSEEGEGDTFDSTVIIDTDKDLRPSRTEVKAEVRKFIREKDSQFSPGDPSNVSWTTPKGTVREYKDLCKSVSKYVPSLRKRLVLESLDKALNIKSTRSGHLDTNKLAEGVQGVSTVYQRFGVQKTSKMAVCILIDESGSMSGSKIIQARKAATLLNLAVEGLPSIELFIYGHSADQKYTGSTEMYVYKEPGIKKPLGLTQVSARWQNRDGFAISSAANRVRRFTDRPVMFFVLSDGQPNASFYGDKGISHTKKVASLLPLKGILPVHIAIENGVGGEDMFKNSVELTDLSKLPQQLGKLLNSSFVKNAQKSITYL